MAEELLHHPHVGPSLEQMRREGVSQVVRRHDPWDARPATVRVEQPRAGLAREPSAASVQEQRPARSSGRERRSPAREVGGHGVARHASDRHEPLLAALAEHPDGRVFEVDVVDVQTHELRHAQTRTVEELEDRPVARRRRGRVPGRLDDRRDLLDGERVRQRSGEPGTHDARGRVVVHDPFAQREPMEGPHRRQHPRDRRRVVRLGVGPVRRCRHRGDERADRLRVDVVERTNLPRAEEPDVALQIAPVRRQGVVGEPALHRQVLQVAACHGLGVRHSASLRRGCCHVPQGGRRRRPTTARGPTWHCAPSPSGPTPPPRAAAGAPPRCRPRDRPRAPLRSRPRTDACTRR